MIASHDPRLIAIAAHLTTDRPKDTHEYQMLYGVRPTEQERIVAEGATMRVYVPYGGDYYGYFMRRLADRPANVTFFLRALAGRNMKDRYWIVPPPREGHLQWPFPPVT